MAIQEQTKAVLCSYQASNDWAVLVAAYRCGDERTITPFIFAGQHATLFAESTRCITWVRAGLVSEMRTNNLGTAAQERLIADAVDYTVEGIQSVARVLEYIKNPGATEAFLRRLLTVKAPLENFHLGQEPAYRWMVEKSDAVFRVHATIRHLVKKHRLDELSQAEREEMHQRAILHKAGAKPVTDWADIRP
jgi:hypothetical protein